MGLMDQHAARVWKGPPKKYGRVNNGSPNVPVGGMLVERLSHLYCFGALGKHDDW